MFLFCSAQNIDIISQLCIKIHASNDGHTGPGEASFLGRAEQNLMRDTHTLKV